MMNRFKECHISLKFENTKRDSSDITLVERKDDNEDDGGLYYWVKIGGVDLVGNNMGDSWGLSGPFNVSENIINCFNNSTNSNTSLEEFKTPLIEYPIFADYTEEILSEEKKMIIKKKLDFMKKIDEKCKLEINKDSEKWERQISRIYSPLFVSFLSDSDLYNICSSLPSLVSSDYSSSFIEFLKTLTFYPFLDSNLISREERDIDLFNFIVYLSSRSIIHSDFITDEVFFFYKLLMWFFKK
jgi:hypothetical protein